MSVNARGVSTSLDGLYSQRAIMLRIFQIGPPSNR
jgi:hypothetical protein